MLAYASGGRFLRTLAAEAAATGLIDVSSVAPLGRVRLVEGSRIEGPGKACLRRHLCYDVAGQRIADFAITPFDQGETLDRVPVGRSDIVLADRGYPKPKAMRATREAGADQLIRLTWNSLNLRDRAGKAIDWLDVFAKADLAGCVDMPINVHKARGRFNPLPLRLVIIPKPPEIAERARDLAHRNFRNDQHNIDLRTLKAAGYIIVINSLDAVKLLPATLVSLCRVRWQIEVAFKRLKSILHLDRLTAKDAGLARAWIATHLLLALFIDETAAETVAFPPPNPEQTPPRSIPQISPHTGCGERLV
jgi:hypothetical protein